MSKLYVNLPGYQTDEARKYTRQLTELLCTDTVQELTATNGEKFLFGSIGEDKQGLIEYLCAIDALPVTSEDTMRVVAPDLVK